MAVLKVQLDWYGNGGKDNAVTITDYESINVSKGAEPKSNTMEILLKHPMKKWIDDATGLLMFNENDIFKLYAKNDRDNTGLDTSASSSDLLLIGELQDIDTVLEDKKSTLKLKCVDRTYILLNRIWSKTYSISQEKNAPEIIQEIIRVTTDLSTKSDNELFDDDGNKGGIYEVDARLDSDGSGTGFIETDRPSQGTPDTDTSLFPSGDNTKFPYISFAKSTKPVYEWINDLSTIQYCNTPDEQDPTVTSASLVVKRAMRYYVDELYRFHWFYPTETPALYMTDGTITAISPDTSKHLINSIKGKYSVFDIVNFVIFRAGTDMNGAQILGYELDTNALQLKPTFRPLVKIAEKMKKDDYDAGNLTRSANGDVRYYDYPAGYPVTPSWSRVGAVTDDGNYNDEFRDEAIRRGKAEAKRIIFGANNPRWKITLKIVGENLTPADLIQYNSDKFGLIDRYLRINNIKHNITNGGWSTSLTLEEDEEEVEG